MTTIDPRAAAIEAAAFHRAEDAEERGEGICRTCLAPIWNEGGTVGHTKRAEGWSDRIERGGDSLVCFKAVEYRHVPLKSREAAIYDRAYERGVAAAVPHLIAGLRALADEWSEPIGYDFRDLIRLCCTHDLREALDAIEAGATSEGGQS